MHTFRGPLFATVSLGVLLVGVLLLLELLTTSHFLHRRRAPAIEATAAIVTRIQNLSELVTARMAVDKIVRLSSPDGLQGPQGKDQTTLLVHGIVKAGFDLAQLSPAKVRVRGRRISIVLPSPEIIECEIEEHHTEVWDPQAAFFRPFQKSLGENARKQAVDALKGRATASRLQAEALERARLELTAFFKAQGFEHVEVHGS